MRTSAFAIAVYVATSSIGHAADYTFSPPQCDFSVTFPSQPSLRNIGTQSGLLYPEAEFIDEKFGSFLRAVCLPIAPTDYRDRQSMLDMLSTFAAQQGISNVEYQAGISSTGLWAKLRGSKNIQTVPSTWVTYEAQCFRGNASIACVSTGAPSAIYPTSAIHRFQKSVNSGSRTSDSNSNPEWVLIGNSASKNVYVNKASIRKSGSNAKMWDLQSNKAVEVDVHGKSFMSMKAHREYDCREKRVRVLAVQEFSLAMGEGATVGSWVRSDTGIDATRWNGVAHGSIDAGMWEIACGTS